MNQSITAVGGFDFPKVYVQEQKKVLEALMQGNIDYADFSQWSFADEFLCFALQSNFFKFADQSYPNPRKKNEVPIWFLLSCQFLLRLYESGKYHHLRHLMNAGSVLSRIGFNVSQFPQIGFNQKNKKERKTAVDSDTVRKFFKDTHPGQIRAWYNEDLQRWFKSKQSFDSKGIFLLDETHLVVPDNSNYEDAVRMPVDEHGQWYKGYNDFSPEQKKALPHHPCYALSCLLHIGTTQDLFHVSGYELGPGNEDELVQAERLVPKFCRAHPGLMKELISDRGYISGPFASRLKIDHDVDSLVPLKKNMLTYLDAVDIAHRNNQWELTSETKDPRSGKLLTRTWVDTIGEMDLWDSCSVKQNAYVSKELSWSDEKQDYEERIWVLGSTKIYPHAKIAVQRYQLRTTVEERFRQFKCGWQIGHFPSPNSSLIESHVCFTLLTYSMLQLYLRREDLRDQTRQMIQTLKREESLGKNVVLVYSGGSFAVLNLDDYSLVLIELQEGPRQKLKEVLEEQKQARLKRAL
jgi:hypothetical protein